VHPDRQCYPVGAPVQLRGTGFASSRAYVVSIDGVYFGQDQTDSAGSFLSTLRPGGLDAGVVQAIERLEASDGTASATATFTVTRAAGAGFVTGAGNAQRLPLEVWGFALDASPRRVFMHWVSPAGRARMTARIGNTGGQCGYLRTAPRAIFPFSPSRGTWTLQLDTRRQYSRRPAGPVARIRVRIG
jgi:hypothetical protein